MDIHLFGGNQRKQSLIKKLVLKNIRDLMLSVLKGQGRGLEGAGREQARKDGDRNTHAGGTGLKFLQDPPYYKEKIRDHDNWG